MASLPLMHMLTHHQLWRLHRNLTLDALPVVGAAAKAIVPTERCRSQCRWAESFAACGMHASTAATLSLPHPAGQVDDATSPAGAPVDDPPHCCQGPTAAASTCSGS